MPNDFAGVLIGVVTDRDDPQQEGRIQVRFPTFPDALGSFSRAGLQLNGFTLDPAAGLLPVPPELRRQFASENLVTGRNNRCPGSAERRAPDGSNPYKPSPDYPCDERQVPVGR